MTRDPSIHITKSSFEKILQDMEITFPIEDFFNRARQMSVDTRVINVTNKNTKRKVNNITLVKNGDAKMAAELYYAVQIKLRFRGVKPIREGDKLWTHCKKLADVCNIFCQDFNLDLRSGYITYINMGFKRLGRDHKNALPRIVAMAQNISEDYTAVQEINKDIDQITTSNIHDYYCTVIADRAGIKFDYHDQPNIYVYFVRLREFCDKSNIDYEDWIDAQFEGLAWCNGLPTPDRLMGDKANTYYAQFAFKHNIENHSPKVSGSLWDKIKESDD